MRADIKCAWGQWFVTPHDGTRGGIAVASKKAALQLCEERGWEPVIERGKACTDRGLK